MILVTRLNGSVFALNPDLVERADHTPDTVVTLVDGTKYIIAESLVELMDLVRRYRASLLVEARYFGAVADLAATDDPTAVGLTTVDPAADENAVQGNVVQFHRKDR